MWDLLHKIILEILCDGLIFSGILPGGCALLRLTADFLSSSLSVVLENKPALIYCKQSGAFFYFLIKVANSLS